MHGGTSRQAFALLASITINYLQGQLPDLIGLSRHTLSGRGGFTSTARWPALLFRGFSDLHSLALAHLGHQQGTWGMSSLGFMAGRCQAAASRHNEVISAARARCKGSLAS